MRTIRIVLPFILIGLYSTICVGQKNKEIPLKTVLDTLEIRFMVSFSYADEYIENIFMAELPTFKSLNSALKYLEQNTDLEFTVLSKTDVAIGKAPKDDVHSYCFVFKDIDTSEPLIGATLNSSTASGIADETGTVRIQTTAFDTLSINYLGYQPKLIVTHSPQADECRTVLLKINPTYLDEVTIRNYVVKGIDKRINGSFRIRPDQTEILPGLIEPDVLHTLQQLPGVQSTNETISNINVRGGSNDQNLILWEGIKMYQPGHFFGLISAFNPYLTDHVDLIKNGSPAKYHEGISSTIDIRSYDDLNTKFEGGAGLNMINGDLYAKIPVRDNIALHFSGRRSFTDLFDTPTFDNYFERIFIDTEITNQSNSRARNQSFYFYDYSGKLLYDITDNDKLRVSFLNIFNAVEVEESAVVANTLQSRTSDVSQSNLAGRISYDKNWGKNNRSGFNLNVSSYELRSVNYDIPNDQRFIQENEVLDLTFQAETEYQLNERLRLTGGYQFIEIGITNLNDLNNPTFRRRIKEVVRSHHPYVALQYVSNSGKTVIRPGFRTNYFTKFDKWRIEPRLSINQLLTDELSLEILAESKSQVTTQIIDFQSDFLGVENRRWVLVNEEDIPLIKSRQLSAGLNFQKNNILASVEGYIKRADGIITSSQGFRNQFEFVRTSGSYDSWGIDFLQNVRWGKFSGWASYSYSESLYQFGAISTDRFPSNFDVRHLVSIGSSFTSDAFELSAGLNVRSGRPYTSAALTGTGEILYSSPNMERTSIYLRPDLSLKYKFDLFNSARAQIGAALWNVIDQDNVLERYYRLEGESLTVINERALRLTPNFMIRVSF